MTKRLLPLALAALAAACGSGSVGVTGVTLKAATSLVVGGAEQLTAAVEPANAADLRVTWRSSAPGVVTVSDAGLVTAVAVGTARVTVTTHEGGKTATCVVSVLAASAAVTGVTLDPATVLSLTAGSPGSSASLTAIVAPATATNQNVTWSTSDEAVASLSSTTGSSVAVTAHAAGTATVTVTTVDGARTDTCVVTVHPPSGPPIAVTGVTLDPATVLSLTAGSPGSSASLTAVVAPATATNRSVTWSTSDETVASLSSTTGSSVVVTAHAAGSARITVTTVDGARTDTCVVTVSPPSGPPIAVTGVTLDRSALLLEAGAPDGTSGTVTATIAPANATTRTVTWATGDGAVATVSATAGSAATVTAHAAGLTTLTATTDDGRHVATATVNVAFLDAVIAGSTASTRLMPNAAPYYDTKLDGIVYSEAPVEKLLLYGEDQAFGDGDGDGGIFFRTYASPSPWVGATQTMRSYVAIPVPTVARSSPSVKVILRAKSTRAPASPPVATDARLLLMVHTGAASGRVIAAGPPLTPTATRYEFDGVPANAQLDVCNGAAVTGSMYLEAIRVEPSATPEAHTTPPAEVTGLTAVIPAGRADEVVLAWTNPGDPDFQGVEISSADLASPVFVGSTDRTHTLTGLTASKPHTFLVRTFDTSGAASTGVTVTATLLDEPLTGALADAVGAYIASSSPSTPTSYAGSSFVFRAAAVCNGENCFKASGGMFLFNYKGLIFPTPVGGTAAPILYVAIPPAYAGTAAPSLRITVTAARFENNAMNVLLLDAANKVLAALPVTNTAFGTAAVPTPYVFDGVAPGGEIRISGDLPHLLLTHVKVEPSAAAISTP